MLYQVSNSAQTNPASKIASSLNRPKGAISLANTFSMAHCGHVEPIRAKSHQLHTHAPWAYRKTINTPNQPFDQNPYRAPIKQSTIVAAKSSLGWWTTFDIVSISWSRFFSSLFRTSKQSESERGNGANELIFGWFGFPYRDRIFRWYEWHWNKLCKSKKLWGRTLYIYYIQDNMSFVCLCVEVLRYFIYQEIFL